MGNRRWTLMAMPERRPSGIDHENGSRMVRSRHSGIALPPRKAHFIITPSGEQSRPPLSPSSNQGAPMPRNLLHTGRKIQVFVETTELPDGKIITRDLILPPGAVIILPVLDDDRVVLLRNHRPNVGETLWEIPAGTLEPGEDPAV